MPFTDDFERSDRDLSGDNGWTVIPKWVIESGKAVCAPLPGGGGRLYLCDVTDTDGTWTLSSHLPDPVALFPGGIWPRYYLMGVARYEPVTGYGIYWRIQWNFDDSLDYLSTEVEVYSWTSAGQLAVTMSGGGGFPAKAAGDAVSAAMTLDSSGNISITSGANTVSGVIDAGAFAELESNISGISSDENYEPLPIESYTSPDGLGGTITDDFERSDRDLDGDFITGKLWFTEPRYQIVDGTARSISDRTFKQGQLFALKDAGVSTHWEWHVTMVDPPNGYPGSVQFNGIVRTSLDFEEVFGTSAIYVTVLLNYTDADTFDSGSAWIDVYAPDGDTPVSGALAAFTAIPGDSLDISLDIDGLDFTLTVNGEILTGTTASDLTTNLPGTYAGFVWTGQPVESIITQLSGEPTLESLEVYPNTTQVLYVGDTLQLSAIGTYSDESTENLSSEVTWPDLSPVASISSSGLLTVLASGTIEAGEEVTFEALTAELPEINTTTDTRITIRDDKSTAPHGMYFILKVLVEADSLLLTDPDDDSWGFEITMPDGFLVDDVILGSSDYNNKYLYLNRDDELISIVDGIIPGSVWPMIFPGENKFEWSPEAVKWSQVSYYPTYWGV